MKLLISRSENSVVKVRTYRFCTKKEDLSDLNDCVQMLPCLTKNEIKKFQQYQKNLVNDLRKCNFHNNVFMSSPLGCENMWQSDFFMALENLFRFIELLKKNQDFIISCDDSSWWSIIQSEAIKKGYSVKFINKNFPFIKFNIRVKNFYSAFCNVLNLTLPLTRKISIEKYNFDYVFFSTWFQRTLKNYKNDNMDPFFTDLPFLMKSTSLFCHVDNFTKNNIKDFEEIKDKKIYTYYHLLNIFDVIRIFLKLIFCSFTVSEKYFSLKQCIKADVSKTKWIQSLHALMIESVCTKIIKANPNVQIIHTFEGNCWEKGIIFALNKFKHLSPNVYGYQHTGFSEFQQKLNASNPLFPKKIISTGVAATQALIKNFSHNESSVITGCYLRGIMFSKAPLKKCFPKEINNILVLLQGTPLDNLFLTKVKEYTKEFKGKISVRLHPAFQDQHLKLPDSFYISDGLLSDNLMDNDIVIHNGTTAALEAAYYGVPTIYLDLGFAYANNISLMLEKNLLYQKSISKNSLKEINNIFNKNENIFEESLTNFREAYELFFNFPDPEEKNKIISILER